MAATAPTRRRGSLVARVLLAAGMLLCAVNLWSGGPLLAVWVGSKAQGGLGPSMGALALVALVLVVVETLLVQALGRLTAAYDRVTGVTRPRRQATWLKAMSGERAKYSAAARLTMPERILVVAVALGVIVFEFWFFFLAGSSLPNN